MAKRKRMPKSIRKFIRKEKARIRREILDIKEQEKSISELYEKTQQETGNRKQKTVKKTNS